MSRLERFVKVDCDFRRIENFCKSNVDVGGNTTFETNSNMIETDTGTIIVVDIKSRPTAITIDVSFINCKKFSCTKGEDDNKSDERCDDRIVNVNTTFQQVYHLLDVGHCISELEKLNKRCLTYVTSY